jgi:hypothetical protein
MRKREGEGLLGLRSLLRGLREKEETMPLHRLNAEQLETLKIIEMRRFILLSLLIITTLLSCSKGKPIDLPLANFYGENTSKTFQEERGTVEIGVGKVPCFLYNSYHEYAYNEKDKIYIAVEQYFAKEGYFFESWDSSEFTDTPYSVIEVMKKIGCDVASFYYFYENNQRMRLFFTIWDRDTDQYTTIFYTCYRWK